MARLTFLLLAATLYATPALAQGASGTHPGPFASPPPGGKDVSQRGVLTMTGAEKVLAAAEQAARQHQAPSSIAVVDPAGDLLAFARMDGGRPAGVALAIRKARSAARYQEPTQTLERTINGGRPAAITAGTMQMQGGIPVASGGAVIGAIGVSGTSKDNDVAIAQNAAAAVD